MKRTAPLVSLVALLGILAACSKEPDVTPADPPVKVAFTNLERFSGMPPADLLKDEQIGKLIRSLVPQSDFKCLDEAMEWMPDLELASDGSLGVRQTGSHADQFRETYLSITPKGSFDLVLLCQIDAPGIPKGKYQHFTNSADLKSPSKPVQEWLYSLGRAGDIVAVSDGKQVMDVPFDTFVAALSAGAAAPTERQATASPAHASADAKAAPAPEPPQTGGGGMIGSIMETLAKPFSSDSGEKSGMLPTLQYAGAAKTMLRSRVKHPDSMEVSNIVVRYEDGSARILAVTFSASNSYGVRDTHAALLSFRINGDKIKYSGEGGVITGNAPSGNAQEDKLLSPYHINIDHNIGMFKNEWSETAMSR